MKKPAGFYLQFPRLVNLEKRISGPAELSVDQIKILEKKIITSIQEISSSLEKDDPNQIKEIAAIEQNRDLIQEKTLEKSEFELTTEKLEGVREKIENTMEKAEMPLEKPPENERTLEDMKNELQIIKPQESGLKEKKPLNGSESTRKVSKQSVPKRRMDDGSKQACLDEYFLEKTPNENSMGVVGLKPKQPPKTPKDTSKSLISSPMPFQVNAQFDYEREIKTLREKLSEKEQEAKEKESTLSRLNEEKAKYKEIHENFIEDFLNYKNQVQKLLSSYLLECERYKKNEIKTHLASQRNRLGEYISQRNGSKFEDIWVDGYEMRNLKEKINNLTKTQAELKNRKKGFKKVKDEDPAVILEKETISHQIKLLTTEEESNKERLEKLNQEIFDFVGEYKKQYEEDHSKYGKPNQNEGKPLWPILGERYQLLSLIGKGGFSEVYKAFDLEDFHMVACKIHELNPIWSENIKQNYLKHAMREIEIHKSLNHLNIVKLNDIVEINTNSFCTVLEYCEGPDLGYHLKKHKTLPEKEARIIIKQIVNGVKYLNQNNPKVIHYDLKPQNVLFHKGIIKISDFGLCKILDDDATKTELTSQGLGTYWYLPPECFQTQSTSVESATISTKVDVWSIGVIFYEMLYGIKPFGNAVSQEKILQDKVILRASTVTFPSSPAVSNEAKDFIGKCLEYDQFKRPDIVVIANLNYLIKK